MTVTTLLLLAASAAVSVTPSAAPLPRWTTAVLAAALLGLAAVTATQTGPAHGVSLAATYVVTVLAAAAGGSTMVTAVFRLARRRGTTDPDGSAGPLHGGRTIGVLERTAVAAAILAGWPEGIAIVLAVKGLARYPELRAAEPVTSSTTPTSPATPTATSASEQFIIGTFTSVVWAVAVCGVGYALVS